MNIIRHATFCILLCLISPFSFSTSSHNFTSGMSLEVELPPNDPQVFYNFLLWKVKGTCEIVSDSMENPITFTMLNNKGTLNGVEFVPGESLNLVAMPGQHFELAAEPRAKVEVTNLGPNLITLHCST